MAPTAALFGLWDEGENFEPEVVVDCLLPTGIMIPLQVRKECTLAEIKEELWRESQKYPLYSSLKDKNTYMFMCINQMAEKEELVDETKRLCDVRPFHPMLKVEEKKGDKAETILNFQISNLIGKGLHEFDALKSLEVSDFRVRMKHLCRSTAKERDSRDWLERAMYRHPPDVTFETELPSHIRDRLKDSNVMVVIQIENTNVSYTFRVPYTAYPDELVDLVLHKWLNYTGQTMQDRSDYVLKVIGQYDFLIGKYQLSQFHVIRRSVVKDDTPQFILMNKKVLFENEPPTLPPRINGKPQPPRVNQRRSKMKGVDLWDLKDKYTLTVHMATNVSLDDHIKVFLRIGIYHGTETTCGHLNTKEFLLTDSCSTLEEVLEFDIELNNIPRMARLCMAMFAINDKQKGKGTIGKRVRQGKLDYVPLAWVNLPVFDYRDVMRSGRQVLYMWPITDDNILTEELLNPIGTVECNPNAEEAICISFTCHDYEQTSPIFYPTFEKVKEVASAHKDQRSQQYDIVMRDMDKGHLENLRVMIEADPLQTLHEQEKELIWRLRYECQYHFPHCLARLLLCIQWNDHVHVALMQDLLLMWPQLKTQYALELLDCNYADRAVRKFAVKCLHEISDSELCQYLLQLVQVLKYESYLECDLVEFLLKRALSSQRVGHMFFWLLRSEMHVASVSVRYGLILEAYCHGSIGHVKSLTKQVAALNKFASIVKVVHSEAYKNISNPQVRSQAREDMRKRLQQNSFTEVLTNINYTLDPTFRLKCLRVNDCKFMDSKKRPLWLVWENEDKCGDDIYMMYKKGDDLRQDMLTLQILRIIEGIWQAEGLDLRMNAYGCLATGHEEGLIELVKDSDTLANIQKQYTALKVRAAFNKECLYKWLLSKNREPENLTKAIEEFTLSCAGYCVATYVLGIGDRHSDNIMLKANGQLFHIDFGHFLGDFKSKLGVKRERVPFVLISDFVYVIKGGPENSDGYFNRFKRLCEEAFLILRRKAHFLITLFMMMMNTGIAQLSSLKGIMYLKHALQPQTTQEEALIHFREKFNEALKNSWKTQLNFLAHNIRVTNN